MKLFRRTFLSLSALILPLFIVGSAIIYFTFRYVIYEEADEFLTYEMERLVEYHRQYQDLPDYHRVAEIIAGQKVEKPYFRDTLILEPSDNEMVPHRDLVFSIHHKGEDFMIVLRHLIPGKDDLLEGTLLITAGVMLLMVVALVLMVSYLSGRIWRPFYQTVRLLSGYRISQPPPAFPKTNIEEFSSLNQTVAGLLQKMNGDYQRTRDFNANASHELQTHLALIRANTEQLLNLPPGDPSFPEKLRNIQNATIKLSGVQKSLLLLSRIGNQEFSNAVDLELKDYLTASLDLFREAIELRGIRLTTRVEACPLRMDPGLAEILVTNLVKNAVKHNVEGGFIEVTLNRLELVIANSGLPYDGNPSGLMERFVKGTQGNMGIGLAIVKQICDLHRMEIGYTITEKTLHTLKISFPGL